MYQNLQDQSMQMSQTENDSASAMQTAQQQENFVNESQNRIMAIAEHIQHPVSTRYDDIYYPRTDKRVIRKFFKILPANPNCFVEFGMNSYIFSLILSIFLTSVSFRW